MIWLPANHNAVCPVGAVRLGLSALLPDSDLARLSHQHISTGGLLAHCIMAISQTQAEAEGLNSISAGPPPVTTVTPPVASTVPPTTTVTAAGPVTSTAASAAATSTTTATGPATSTVRIAFDDNANPPLPAEALAPSPVKKVAGQRRKEKKKRKRSAVPPPDADETDDTGAQADLESDVDGVIFISEAPAADAEKGNKPVSGQLSWQQEPCRTCHRPYNTAPPREVWVAYGKDRQGRTIEYKYIRVRTADGTRRRERGPHHGRRAAGVRASSSARSSSDPDEVIQYIAGVKQGRRPVQAIWARRLPAGKGPSDARKRALTHVRHEATGSEKPPKIPHYIPP